LWKGRREGGVVIEVRWSSFSMSKKETIVCTFQPADEKVLEEFKDEFNIILPHNTPLMAQEELLAHLPEAHAVIHCQLNFKFTDDLFAQAPNLKVLANHGVGYDGLDVDSATRRRIIVTNTPKVVNEATADITLFLILATTRCTTQAEAHIRTGKWVERRLNDFVGHDLRGKTLGIIGLGGIGQAVARRAVGFGLKIIYYQRNSHSREKENSLSVKYSTFENLLSQSDYITLHCPLTPQTRDLIGKAEFEKMKRGVYLINTARGPIVNEAALIAALKSGIVAGVGLDVYDNEPYVPQELQELPNVTLLPHIGTCSFESRNDMLKLCLDNCRAVLRDDSPLTPINTIEDVVTS